MGTNQSIQTKIYNNSKSSCVICLEKHYKGILCPSDKHFICHECFLPFIENILNDAGRLIDNNCRICCPVPECENHSWTTHQLRKILSSEIFEKYVDTIANVATSSDPSNKNVEFNENDIDAGAKVVIESLTLGCPSCKIALDPDPDGCCAIRCRSCSKYFCLLCFLILSNNLTCHSHVRECPQNPSKNVFAPASIRQEAQRKLQIKAIREVFRSKYGQKWRQISYCRLIIGKCSKILKDSKITEQDIMKVDELDNQPRMQQQQQQQQQQQETGIEKKHLYLAFFCGVFVTLLINSMFSSSSSSSTTTTTTISCPSIDYEFKEDMFDDIPSSSSSPLERPFELVESNISFIEKAFSTLSYIFIYVLKGGCWALALNYFTSQYLLDNPILALLAVLLWKPIGIILYYLSYIITYLLYYLNSSVLILMGFMAIIQKNENRNKYFVSIAILSCTLAVIYFLKSFFE